MAEYGSDEQRIALFIDYENIAIGVREARYRNFEIDLVLERLLDKGKLLVKKAYADWARYGEARRSFHEAAIELIEVPQKSVGGKNSADIRMVVDAMDMSFQKEHINCFVVASGDSDFSPLVSKLKENNKYVIGLGVKNSTSDLLMENCDEFIFYEDLVRGKQRPLPTLDKVNTKLQEGFSLLIDAVLALERENKEILWGSMVKETMKRKRPSFNETYYGFRTFSHLLEDAQRRGIVKLRRDQRSGSYIIEDLGPGHAQATSSKPAAGGGPAAAAKAPSSQEPAPEATAAAAGSEATENGARSSSPSSSSRRRRGRGGRARRQTPATEANGEAPVDGAPDEASDDASSGASAAEPAAAQREGGEPKTPEEAAERPAFSFFSWIRGDNPEEGEENDAQGDRERDR